jgi:hypothetical protein
VQSSSTKKVATDDLTVKNVRSNATTGILQIAGPATAATRIMTVPDANFTAARTDAAQSFTGDQTLGTGNLIQGTAGKGINFTANTPAAGMTSELLNWYEEGTFTANLTALATGPTTPVSVTARYTRIGRTVTVQFNFGNVDTTGASGELTITNLPYVSGLASFGSCFMISNGSAVATLFIQPSSSQIFFLDAVTGAYISISAGAGKYYGGTITYTV